MDIEVKLYCLAIMLVFCVPVLVTYTILGFAINFIKFGNKLSCIKWIYVKSLF